MSKPKMPPGLGPEAKRVWRRLVRELPNATSQDADALAMLATSLAIAHRAALEIERDGVLRPDQHRGRLAKNPAWQVYREASQAARQLLVEFAMTPVSRNRARLPDPPKFDRYQLFKLRQKPEEQLTEEEKEALFVDELFGDGI